VLVQQLAFVVSFSLICSLLASITLTPALAAHWIKVTPGTVKHDGRGLWRLTQRLHGLTRSTLTAVEQAYGRALAGALRAPGLVVVLLLLAFCATLGLLPRVGSEFLPQPDDGRLGITGTMAPATRLETLDSQTRRIEQALFRHVPDAESVSVFVGDEADDGDSWHECRFSVQLPPRSQRHESVDQVRKRIVTCLPETAGMRVTTRVYSGLPIFRMFGSGEGDALALLVRGHDRATAEQLADAAAAQMRRVPGIVNVELQQDEQRPELSTLVDRSKAALLDINVQAITQALATTIRGTPATVYREDGDEFNVTVRLRESDRRRLADVGQVGIATPLGQIVPLKNLVRFEPGESPLTIERLDRQRVAIVSAGVEGRDLGSVVEELEQKLAALPLPEDFTIDIGGDWEEQQESFRALQFGFVLAVVFMYIIMAAQFESLRDPLLILLTLPLGAIGVMLVFVFWGTTLNVQSFIGIVVLAGIVVNNAIVLVDYVNQLRQAEPEADVKTLIQRAAVRRLRPILMTTLTTVLGMWPMALGHGDGGELQAPLARVIFGGLLSGTLMTLVAIPVVYWGVSRPRRVEAAQEAESSASRELVTT
jgi:HAE1 family hydrophobic/amphiphilic exporter-1